MGVQIFESEEVMDDAFEGMMESEQDKARLREEIKHAEYEVENRHDDLVNAKDELADLQKQLEELEDS